MRTTARLHANLTTRLHRLEEDSEPIGPRQLPPPYHPLVAIDPMHLKYRLCQIYANTHKLHGGPLLSVDWSMTPPVWHLDAVQVRRGPSHCFQTHDVGPPSAEADMPIGSARIFTTECSALILGNSCLAQACIEVGLLQIEVRLTSRSRHGLQTSNRQVGLEVQCVRLRGGGLCHGALLRVNGNQ